MPRKRNAGRVYAEVEEWFAARDRCGLWTVVNSRGEQVLRSPDARVRLEAVHLAAAAPLLRALLSAVTVRLESYLLDHGAAYSRDARLVAEARIIVGMSVPPLDLLMASDGGAQFELGLDGEGEPERVAGLHGRAGSTRVG